MSKINEDEKKNWNDNRVIDAETLKHLDKSIIGPTPNPKKGERKGDPTQSDGKYQDGGCPR